MFTNNFFEYLKITLFGGAFNTRQRATSMRSPSGALLSAVTNSVADVGLAERTGNTIKIDYSAYFQIDSYSGDYESTAYNLNDIITINNPTMNIQFGEQDGEGSIIITISGSYTGEPTTIKHIGIYKYIDNDFDNNSTLIDIIDCNIPLNVGAFSYTVNVNMREALV